MRGEIVRPQIGFDFDDAADALDANYSDRVIRPPGSVDEKEFLERCIKCDQCINVCPTNVLQPRFVKFSAQIDF